MYILCVISGAEPGGEEILGVHRRARILVVKEEAGQQEPQDGDEYAQKFSAG